MSGSQPNMSDYLNFDEVLQSSSSPFNPFTTADYDFNSPLNATDGTQQPNAIGSTSTSHSPWSPPGLSYALTSPEESNVSPSAVSIGDMSAPFSPVLVGDYLTDGGFDLGGMDFMAGMDMGFSKEPKLPTSFGGNGNAMVNGRDLATNNNSRQTQGYTVDPALFNVNGNVLPMSPPLSGKESREPSPFSEIKVKQEPGTEDYLINDPSPFFTGGGGTVNTADLFGPIPVVNAGTIKEMQQGPAFNGSIAFGNASEEDVTMREYLGSLAATMRPGQANLETMQDEEEQPEQEEEDEEEMDSVNAASPRAPSSIASSSRKPSINKPAPKRAAGKKATAPVSLKRKDSARSGSDDERAMTDELESLPLPAMFGGVKGKGGKKGGGMSSVVLEDGEEAGEEDDWRPSAEEYKKMSSKEKRQLRNKLSARAFRNRRKTYINELEDHIKDRDRLIDAIRNELKNFRSENDDLRREIGMMKKAAMEPAEEMTPALSPSRSMSGSSMTTSNKASTSSSPINTFNPRKDVPASTSALLNQMSPRSMWGEGSGGYTSVHATFMPDLALPPTLSMNIPRQNLNPFLNMVNEPMSKAPHPFKSDGNNLGESFDAWSAETPFSYRSLEAYRMQLWSRMARDASLAKQGVPLDMRPKFLKEPTEEKQANAASSASTASTGLAPEAVPAPVLSNVISSAISSRLFSAFISAFQAPTGRGLDGDRVAAVFTGKAGLKVVDNAAPAATSPTQTATPLSKSETEADAALAASFAHLRVATESLGLKSPSTESSKPLSPSDEEGRGWGFLSRSVVRG